MKKLLILGAGQFGVLIKELCDISGEWDKVSFLDDKSDKAIDRLDSFEKYTSEYDYAYAAFGNNTMRRTWLEKLEKYYKIPTLIHPTAFVSPSAKLGCGSAILPKAVIHTNSVVGKGCIVNVGALLDHDSVLEDYAHLCVGVVVKARCIIKENSRVESGTVIQDECLFETSRR